MVDCCLIPPSWLGSRKPLAVMWNWSLLLMAFSISLPIVFSRTMGLNDLGELYDSLLGLGMMTDDDALNCGGHVSNLMHALAMWVILSRHTLSAVIALRCLQEIWSGPGVDNEEHLVKVSLSSWLEKGGHSMGSLCGISLMISRLTGRLAAALYDW